VEFENAQVRVLRVQYGPHEKSVMHSHPAGVVVFMSDQQGRFTLPGGKSEDRSAKAGEVRWEPAETHLPENLGDKPLEVILVELKGKAPAARKK
jgi:quercetin dioxygenase-like cupin family protein